MMDQIMSDLEKDMKDSENAEKTAFADYNKLMSSSQESRAQDSKSLTDKSATKAQLETKLVEEKDAESLATEKLGIAKKYSSELHASCDFILTNFALRKDA